MHIYSHNLSYKPISLGADCHWSMELEFIPCSLIAHNVGWSYVCQAVIAVCIEINVHVVVDSSYGGPGYGGNMGGSSFQPQPSGGKWWLMSVDANETCFAKLLAPCITCIRVPQIFPLLL